MKLLQRVSLVAGVALLGALMSLPLAAQQFSGIKGTVIGLSNKPLVNGQITLTRTDAKGVVNLKTNKKGQFSDNRILAGTYTISVKSETGQEITVAENIKFPEGKEVDTHTISLPVIAAAVNGGPPPKGMSKEEADEYAAHKKEAEAKNAKTGQLNTLLAQNKQFYDAKQYAQAIAVMQQAVAIDQKHDILYANLAEDYAAAKQYKEAADAYQKALALKPTDAGYQINLGSVLAESGDTAGANAAFNKAAQMDPTQAKLAIYNEGVVLMNKNNLSGATAAFDKVITMDPNDVNAWYYKGMSLLGQAKTDPKTNKMIPLPGTKQAMQKVISLAPNTQQAQTAKAVLQQLGGGK